MSDEPVLSPEEKESLLSEIDQRSDDAAVGADQTSAGGVYDFAAPSHNLLSSVPRLVKTAEIFSERYGASVSRLISHHTLIEQENAKVHSLSDFLATQPPVVSLYLCRLPPFKGYALFVIEPLLLHIVVDRYFGGAGEARNFSDSKKQSAPALKIAEQMSGGFVTEFKESLLDLASTEPAIEFSTMSPDIALLPVEDEEVVQFSYRIGFAETTGLCHMVLPFSLVSEFKTHIETSGELASQVVDADWRDAIASTLDVTALKVRAVAHESDVPLSNLAGMKEGDLLPIEKLDEVILKVGEVIVATGQAGTSEGQNAVQINKINFK